MTDQPAGLFWEASAAARAYADVAASTMMGLPACASLARSSPRIAADLYGEWRIGVLPVRVHIGQI